MLESSRPDSPSVDWLSAVNTGVSRVSNWSPRQNSIFLMEIPQ
ncbi:hypothetical protein RISK_004819 [Rhodopirellula islandica]|uniref:Uncharacterized protein n=1 Tax=Rhodopirellula islandica TaxID=595434 RepID=A0A0J1B948_RHOIS|nr:hypothetical protein RISK_004819 [Rhodopirellula islandica]